MTGARVLRALPYIKSENFALTYGDGVADIDVKAELAFHKKHGCQATVAAVHSPSRFGEMVIDELGQVNHFQEKPDASSGNINGGFFILKRAGLERYLQPAGENLTWEKQPLEKLAREKQLKAFRHPGSWQPMDTYREFELLNKLWSEGKPFGKSGEDFEPASSAGRLRCHPQPRSEGAGAFRASEFC